MDGHDEALKRGIMPCGPHKGQKISALPRDYLDRISKLLKPRSLFYKQVRSAIGFQARKKQRSGDRAMVESDII